MTALTCEHPDLVVECEFNRLTDTEGGQVTAFLLEVKANCQACGMPFCFRGMPLGLSHLAPTMSLDALTVTLPVHPEDDPTTGIGSPGFSVQVTS